MSKVQKLFSDWNLSTSIETQLRAQSLKKFLVIQTISSELSGYKVPKTGKLITVAITINLDIIIPKKNILLF